MPVRRRGPGVGPGAGVPGEHVVPSGGVSNGPTGAEHVVYPRLDLVAAYWPVMGQLIPVVYSPKNPDKWFFAPPE